MTLSDRQQLLSQVFFSRVIQQRGEEDECAQITHDVFFSRVSPDRSIGNDGSVFWKYYGRGMMKIYYLFNLIIYNDIFARNAQLMGWEMFRFMKMSFRFTLNDRSFLIYGIGYGADYGVWRDMAHWLQCAHVWNEARWTEWTMFMCHIIDESYLYDFSRVEVK